MKTAIAPRSGPDTARTASCGSSARSTMRYSPATLASCGISRLLAAAHRRKGGDLLAPGDRAFRHRVGAVAGEQRPLLVPEPRDPGAHLAPDVRERGAGTDLHRDRRCPGGLAIAREEQHGHGHDGSWEIRAADAAWRRLSCTRLKTSAIIASIPDFTSARRVKAGDPRGCTLGRPRSTLSAPGPR